MDTPSSIRQKVREFALRSSYGSEPHRDDILALGVDVLPYFIEAYPSARRWQQRASFLYTAVRYSRVSPLALELAMLALSDKSREVRYRACLLIACSQDLGAVNALEQVRDHPDPATRADVAAALDALHSRNHNYFVDRQHSGKVTYSFGEDQRAP